MQAMVTKEWFPVREDADFECIDYCDDDISQTNSVHNGPILELVFLATLEFILFWWLFHRRTRVFYQKLVQILIGLVKHASQPLLCLAGRN